MIGASLVALGAVVLFLARAFSPSVRLRAAHAALLEAVRDASRSRLARHLAVDYHDSWGQDRTEATDHAVEAARQFLAMRLEVASLESDIRGRTATTRLTVVLDGQGTAAAAVIRQRVARLRTPFVLTWRKESWSPWSWKLVALAHDELEIDAEHRRTSLPAMTNLPIPWGEGVARRICSLAPLALALAGGGGAATPPPAA